MRVDFEQSIRFLQLGEPESLLLRENVGQSSRPSHGSSGNQSANSIDQQRAKDS
jgi:hypothetical protein